MLSELTLTVMRLGLLVLMWFFVFAVVGTIVVLTSAAIVS